MKNLICLACFISVCSFLYADPPKSQQPGNKEKTETAANSNTDIQTFEFRGSLKMNTSTVNNGETATTTLSFYIRDNESAMETGPVNSSEGTRTIFNFQSNELITLMTEGDKKSGTKIKIPNISLEAKESADTKDYTIKKFFETKIIDGYQCEKYIFTYSDGSHTDMWITNALDFNLSSFIELLNNNMNGEAPSICGKYPKLFGLPIEIIYYKKEGTVATTKFSEIKVGKTDAFKFSTEGFEINDMTKTN